MIFYSCAMFQGCVAFKISSAVGRMCNGDIGACCQFAVECSFVGELIVGLSLFTGYGLSHNTMVYSCLHLLDSKKGIRFVRFCLSNYLLSIKLVKKSWFFVAFFEFIGYICRAYTKVKACSLLAQRSGKQECVKPFAQLK